MCKVPQVPPNPISNEAREEKELMTNEKPQDTLRTRVIQVVYDQASIGHCEHDELGMNEDRMRDMGDQYLNLKMEPCCSVG